MTPRKITITEELKEILKKIDNPISSILLREEIEEDMLASPEKIIDYLDISHSNKGHISYLNGERIEKIKENDGDYWEMKMRYHARPGSVIKKMIKSKDYYIESFATQFLSIVDPPSFEMKVVNGADISKYYDYKNYQEQRGSLGGSCMKSSPSDFFDIYSENPEQISMLIMVDQNDKVIGRSILWENEKFKLMDRVYVTNDLYLSYFNRWANENDYYHKEFNNWYTPLNLKYKGLEEEKKLEITLDKSEFHKYPYLDTFKWLDLKNKKLYNYIPENNGHIVVVSDHLGRHLSYDYFAFCDMTKKLCLRSELIYVDYLNKFINSGDIVKSHIYDKYIYIKHAEYEGFIDDYIFNKEYDSYNDHDLILKKKEEIKKRRESSLGSLKFSIVSGVRSRTEDEIGEMFDAHDAPDAPANIVAF